MTSIASGASSQPVEITRVVRLEVVTARQHRHARGGWIAQSMTRSVNAPQACAETTTSSASPATSSGSPVDERHAPGETRPRAGQDVVDRRGRRRDRAIDGDGRRRRIVEQQHHVREQPVPGAQIDDAPAAKPPPRPPRHFPRLVEFLPRQTAGLAHRATETIEERAAGKSPEIVTSQACTRSL